MRTLALRLSITLALFYLLAISIEGLALIFSSNRTALDLFVFFKLGAIAALIAFAVAGARQRERALIAALAVSMVGDFLLVPKELGPFDESRLFLAGLLAFLVAHILYITLFLKNFARQKPSQFRRFSIALVIAVLWFLLSRLWPSLGPMRLPVVIYAVTLSAMVVVAQLSRFPTPVSLGALCFLASDAMLAISHFAHPFPASPPLIWITYYAAQFAICFGVVTTAQTEPSIVKKAPLRRGA